MISYSRPKLSDLYTLYAKENCLNHTLHKASQASKASQVSKASQASKASQVSKAS